MNENNLFTEAKKLLNENKVLNLRLNVNLNLSGAQVRNKMQKVLDQII